jgi:hypothetical protein
VRSGYVPQSLSIADFTSSNQARFIDGLFKLFLGNVGALNLHGFGILEALAVEEGLARYDARGTVWANARLSGLLCASSAGDIFWKH